MYYALRFDRLEYDESKMKADRYVPPDRQRRKPGVAEAPFPVTLGGMSRYLGDQDLPKTFLFNSCGEDGDTFEERANFVTFARIALNGRWWVVSQQYEWHLHVKWVKDRKSWDGRPGKVWRPETVYYGKGHRKL